jgi:hypothetical protein
MAVAFASAMTAPALAQSAHTPTRSAQTWIKWAPTTTPEQAFKELAAASGPCSDLNGYNAATLFWRCTGSSPTSQLVGSSCNQGEYNAGTNYTVWGAINICSTRVWLHQDYFPADETSGWSICIPPNFADPITQWEFPVGESPRNIMVSANSANCTPVLP